MTKAYLSLSIIIYRIAEFQSLSPNEEQYWELWLDFIELQMNATEVWKCEDLEFERIHYFQERAIALPPFNPSHRTFRSFFNILDKLTTKCPLEGFERVRWDSWESEYGCTRYAKVCLPTIIKYLKIEREGRSVEEEIECIREQEEEKRIHDTLWFELFGHDRPYDRNWKHPINI